jgi:hypothetical protein
VEETVVKDLLFDEFQHLDIVNPCATTGTDNFAKEEEIEIMAAPVPFREGLTFQFTSKNEHVRLSVFDALGSELEVLVNKKLPAGEHTLTFNGDRLAAGNYYFRIQMGSRIKTKMVTKI